MQETFIIPLPADFIIPTDSAQLLIAIQSLFNAAGGPYQQLTEALKQEEKEKFGLPEISALSFEVKRYDPIVQIGRLRINYHLRLTFSCSALVNELDKQHSYWNFTIDADAKTFHFEGEAYGDLRSTADEY